MNDDTKMRASGRAAGLAQFDRWPAPLLAWFDGSALADKTGFTASLVTCNADGRIGTSLLGVGELYAASPRTLRFALWAQSRGAGALATHARAALTFVFDAAFYQVQLEVEPLPSEAAKQAGLACFDGTIAAGEVQRVSYAQLDQGIGFSLGDDVRDAVLTRWEAQMEMLKGLG
ncbi:hypothetical protein [Paraburkholderia caballeronis]|uniref:Uncharacterized protein n=1 Tax=Paraburkholderia caballeronis TaxID=416943 RepID=A0A1H7PUB5_9BURK|nr:hypothetical protein [Paraburkholderia caballeronis]PXW24351.1 hypothetical protein C7403_107168 [Paraburkholderia caballeronis]PXX00133.1 hypothetical protein C7407_107168 [Paraburkholderia caballeronis]RAJ97262.1 hypothetical protein C7409_107168 [Paraburkholderia caballeronis]SEB66829.1 hypothetical protein SAMN05445871_0834 [Paraburkholderia caballeronis]SEL39420.1 hypothetical protein SAMN05192542_107168 [Paraburkholderia caballeronis]